MKGLRKSKTPVADKEKAPQVSFFDSLLEPAATPESKKVVSTETEVPETKIATQTKTPEPIAPPAPLVAEPKIWSVSELSKNIRDQLRTHFDRILIQGEICDFKGVHRSGHIYMSIKDDNAQIRVVMWKGAAAKLPFDLKMGLEVIITGSLDYYGAGGSLQMVAEKIEPLGIGSLQLKFEQLKEKLSKEGLFEVSRKKAIPKFANRIALVTGRSTAALQDMLRIFKERSPLTEIYLFHASVQGESAPQEIIAAIKSAERFHGTKNIDVLIVGRGGGSYEDLFCFNDEKLVRAIAACSIPTISAVGHEIDFTISDFVADRRSATPTHAATEASVDLRALGKEIGTLQSFYVKTIQDKIYDLTQKVDFLYSKLLNLAPHIKIKAQSAHLKAQYHRLQQSMERRTEKLKMQVSRLASTLDALSPLKVLDRGYSVTQNKEGNALKSVKNVNKGENLNIRLSDGILIATINDIEALR